MRNRFDHLGKNIGLSALSPSGVTVAHCGMCSVARPITPQKSRSSS